MALQAGKLRHKVTIQQLVTVINSFGEQDSAWQNVGDVWASVEPLSAREFIAAQEMQSKVSARITIRYRDDVTAGMRIVHRGKNYNITGVLADKESGLEYMTCPCSEGVNAG